MWEFHNPFWQWIVYFELNFMLATQSKKWDKSQEKDWKKLNQENKYD